MEGGEVVANGTLNVGFFLLMQEGGGQLGGLLVTNVWGRPLEFRLTTAVQPNRVQQILYGRTMQAYICADLIGKTLLEKTGTPVQLVVTDKADGLDLRLHTEAPVVWLAPPDDPQARALAEQGCEVRPSQKGQEPLLCHARYPNDVAAVRELLERLEGNLDMAEPFMRIREAVGEARKMGVTNKAA